VTGTGIEQETQLKTQSERTEAMRKVLATVLSVMVVSLSASAGMAQTSCPPEVAAAKAMLTQTAKSQDVQAPRSLAGARSQDVQAPRSQEIQAPRSQDIQAPRSLAGARSQDVQAPRSQNIQAPRSQDIQAPRSQDIQAPRSQDIQAPRSAEFKKASTLVSEAEAACKAGNASLAADKAKAAMGLLKK
jgi:hypothetical protein